MGKILKGKDFALLMERDDEVVPVCCSRDAEIAITAETIEATKAPDSQWRSYLYGIKSFTVTCGGLVIIDSSFTQLDFFDAMNTGKTLSFLLRSDDGADMLFYGKVLITQLTITGSHKDVTQYSVSLLGTGPLKNDKTAYDYTLTDGLGNPLDDGNGNTLTQTEYGGDLPVNISIDC